MPIGWIGFATGLAGALLVALGHPAGFWLFLASNLAWIAYAWRRALWPLLLQQLAFTVTSVIGVWRG